MDKFFKWVGILFLLSFLVTCVVTIASEDKNLEQNQTAPDNAVALEKEKERNALKEKKALEKAKKRLWADMGVYCSRLFENSANYGTQLSFHRDKRSKQGDIYQMYWSPEYFKVKNGYGAWKKSEAWCFLEQTKDKKQFDVVFLKIGETTILDRR